MADQLGGKGRNTYGSEQANVLKFNYFCGESQDAIVRDARFAIGAFRKRVSLWLATWQALWLGIDPTKGSDMEPCERYSKFLRSVNYGDSY